MAHTAGPVEDISIHALREEGDRWPYRRSGNRQYFYPRPPRGGRLFIFLSVGISGLISIHALREEGDHGVVTLSLGGKTISIHALREEGDLVNIAGKHRAGRISIHALREEGDRPTVKGRPFLYNFYPRPPRGGRPFFGASSKSGQTDFYPRPPRGGRQAGQSRNPGLAIFLSTPSARRATCRLLASPELFIISIHALREEGDYIRLATLLFAAVFLSTPSARRATAIDFYFFYTPTHFYPRPPRGGRRKRRSCTNTHCAISIHALREEGDLVADVVVRALSDISIHALREEGDMGVPTKVVLNPISIHALREEGDCIAW